MPGALIGLKIMEGESGSALNPKLNPKLHQKVVDGLPFKAMSVEFLQMFSIEADIQGIFGVGAPVEDARTLDI